MLLVVCRADYGTICEIIPSGVVNGARIRRENGREYILRDYQKAVDVPDQDLSVLKRADGSGYAGNVSQLRTYTSEERAGRIDVETGTAIDKAVHPFCGTEETLGILRDQLAQILNSLGMEATAEFARLNKIAVAKIQKGREAKGLAPDGGKTTRLDPSSGLLAKLAAIAAKKG